VRPCPARPPWFHHRGNRPHDGGCLRSCLDPCTRVAPLMPPLKPNLLKPVLLPRARTQKSRVPSPKHCRKSLHRKSLASPCLISLIIPPQLASMCVEPFSGACPFILYAVIWLIRGTASFLSVATTASAASLVSGSSEPLSNSGLGLPTSPGVQGSQQSTPSPVSEQIKAPSQSQSLNQSQGQCRA
jgi:hypothetical protein